MSDTAQDYIQACQDLADLKRTHAEERSDQRLLHREETAEMAQRHAAELSERKLRHQREQADLTRRHAEEQRSTRQTYDQTKSTLQHGRSTNDPNNRRALKQAAQDRLDEIKTAVDQFAARNPISPHFNYFIDKFNIKADISWWILFCQHHFGTWPPDHYRPNKENWDEVLRQHRAADALFHDLWANHRLSNAAIDNNNEARNA